MTQQNQNKGPSVVITKADVDRLNKRLMDLAGAVKRNVLHAKEYGDDIDDVVDNILYDVQYGVVEAWATTLFPGSFSGRTLAQTGQFNLESFELFRENDLIDDILFEDDIDRAVAAQRRKSVKTAALYSLDKGDPVFIADRNPVTSVLQFAPWRYLNEAEAMRWFRHLDAGQVGTYGVFADLKPDTVVKMGRVRFIPLDRQDPSTEKSVFLGWAVCRKELGDSLSFVFEFGECFGAIVGFEDAKFTEDELNCSTFEHSVGRKWATAAA